MTFQPAKLESLSDSLDVEVKSAEILLSRLASLVPDEDGGAEGDKRAERAEWVKKAEGVVRGYISWLADPSKKFEIEVDDSRGDTSKRDVSLPSAFHSSLFSYICIGEAC